jgi:hypothetical protein
MASGMSTRKRPLSAEGCAKHLLQFAHVGQQVLAALKYHLPVLRQLHAARGPVQQAGAQLVFQLLHRQ